MICASVEEPFTRYSPIRNALCILFCVLHWGKCHSTSVYCFKICVYVVHTSNNSTAI